jgi:hypothetical protein
MLLRKFRPCLVVVLLLLQVIAFAQNPPPLQMRTPPEPPAPVTADSEVIQRIRGASGGQRGAGADLVIQGNVTLQTAGGPVVVPVTILRSSTGGQRIQFNQSDGKPWDGNIAHLESNSRRILEFVQTQYERALPNVLGNAKRNVAVFDNGVKEGVHSLNAFETTAVMKADASLPRASEGKAIATRYMIDEKTSRLGRMEFQNGQDTDANGKKTPRIEAYTYSDFRNVRGDATAYHVEHYTNGVKQDDLVLTNVRAIPVNPSPANRGGPRP